MMMENAIGICLDTCHIFAAGYEVRTVDGFDATMELFDEAIGLGRIMVIHLDDSKGGLNS
jgi:endonuclease IV